MTDWLRALGRIFGWLVAGWVLIAAVVLGLGTLLTGPLGDEWPLTAEDEVNTTLADGRTPGWDSVSFWWSEIGDTLTIIGGCILAMVVLRLVLHRWRESLFVVAATIGAVVVMVSASAFIDRERPDVPQMDEAPATSSFPSGHVGASLALYGSLALVVLWRVRRRAVAWLVAVALLALPVLVAYARLYRGMHHPSDLLGALVNAGLCLTLAWAVVVRWSRLPEDDDRAGIRGRGSRRSARDLEVAA